MFVLDTNVKGAVAEMEIAAAAVRLGVPVWKPLAEHGRCDLALEVAGRIWRVQCKWGRLSVGRDVIVVPLRTSRYTPDGYVRTTYTADETDL
jgi:hypothetical protein